MRILGEVMSFDETLFSSLSDEELLARAYASRGLLSSLEIELLHRLEQALSALADRPKGVGDVVTQAAMVAESRTRQQTAMEELMKDSQDMGLYK